jgi:hypothetical protein
MAAKRRGVYKRAQSKPMRRNGHERPFKEHTSSQVGNRIMRENRRLQGDSVVLRMKEKLCKKVINMAHSRANVKFFLWEGNLN